MDKENKIVDYMVKFNTNRYNTVMEEKLYWEKPEIKELGNASDITKGGEGNDPKFIGSGDQFAVNDLTT